MDIKSNIFSYLKTLIITAVFSAILIFLLSLIFYKFKLQESQISIGIIAIYVLSCLLGGILIGKKIRQRKFLWGMLFGILYFLILLCISLCVNRGLLHSISNLLTTLAICTCSGMCGGMCS